jgi:hypothetical protein
LVAQIPDNGTHHEDYNYGGADDQNPHAGGHAEPPSASIPGRTIPPWEVDRDPIWLVRQAKGHLPI